MKKHRVYRIVTRPDLMVWQELRDAGIMNYTAVLEGGNWVLYLRMSTLKSEGDHGDLMRRFQDLNSLCAFLGVPEPDSP